MVLSPAQRIEEIAAKWGEILSPVLTIQCGGGPAAAVDVAQRNLNDADVATLAGYVSCLYGWPDSRPVAEFIVAYHDMLTDQQKLIFKWGILGPLCGYASCNVRQSALLYSLCRMGFTSYDEVRPFIREDHPYWFWIESGMLSEEGAAEYRRRRDEYQGFGQVADAIIRDDVEALTPLISLATYEPKGARFKQSAGDGLEGVVIRNDDQLYPVGMGILEDVPFSLLEFALRWGAHKCFRMLRNGGASPGPRALWAAIQGGDVRLLQELSTALDEDGVQVDKLTVHCAISFAIRMFRIEALDWLLRRHADTVREWGAEMCNWAIDNAAMSNNVLAWSSIVQCAPEAQTEGATWLRMGQPLMHGNLELLEAIFPPQESFNERDGERDVQLRWVIRSLRTDCLLWFCDRCRALAERQWAQIRDEPFMVEWMRRRPEQAAILATLRPPEGRRVA